MRRVDLVVCDIAGTTVKDLDAVGGAVQAALQDFGVEMDLAQINPIMGMPKPVAINILLDEIRSEIDPMAVHAVFVERMLHYYRTSPEVAPIDGVPEAIAELRAAGIKVGLDTGFSHDITGVIIDRLGWGEGVLDGVISSDQVAAGRPAPDMIHHHMERFGITDPDRVAKVGDAPADIQEGRNAQCAYVIGVLSGTHTRVQLEPHAPTHIIESVRDLPALLLEDAHA